MYHLNSVLIEGVVEDVFQESAVTKLILKTISRNATGTCLIEVVSTNIALVEQLTRLSVGQTTRVVGKMRFSDDGTIDCVEAENVQVHG